MRNAPPEKRDGRDFFVIGALIFLVALVLRIAGAAGKELWLDELHSAMITARPISEWILPHQLGGYSPLYFLFSLPFSRLGGDFITRIPSIFFGALTALIIYRWAVTHLNRSAALYAGILTALAPALIVFSSYHRQYALYVLFITSSFIFFSLPGKRAAVGFFFTNIAALLTFPIAGNYTAAFVLLALAERRRVKLAFATLVAVSCLALLYFLPMASGITEETAGGASRFPPLTGYLFLRFPKFLSMGPVGPYHENLRMLAQPLLAFSWLTLAWAIFLQKNPLLRQAGILVILPPLFEAPLRLIGVELFQDKSYLPGTVFLMIVFAGFIASVRINFRRTGVLFFSTLIAVFTLIDAFWIDPSQPFSMKERRDIRQRPLFEAAEEYSRAASDNTRTLVLSNPSSILGALRYGKAGQISRFAFAPAIEDAVATQAYQDLILKSIGKAGIKIVNGNELPNEYLWIGRDPHFDSDEAETFVVAVSPAGMKLWLVRRQTVP